jgi:hypothetical protein
LAAPDGPSDVVFTLAMHMSSLKTCARLLVLIAARCTGAFEKLAVHPAEQIAASKFGRGKL